MFKKIMLSAIALMMFMVVPAFADKNCATGDFVGTYTRLTPASDPVGDGILHAYVFQLTLHADGTVTQYWTGLPDYQNTLGTGSINIGAWKCRDNGNLLVTLLSASYAPIAANPGFGTLDDVRLVSHQRSTMVFNIDDNNTVTRLKSRTRNYAPAADPTDPNGGTLGALNTTLVVYKRLVASAADLTAP
ncbi:MAG: hypothetical protein ABI999_06195 [Acidobacteriota bacterium]